VDAGRSSPERLAPAVASLRRYGPVLLVGIAIVFNLWILRAEVLPAQNLNDAAVHSSMVRWAESRIREGHLPFDGWYPYLSLGASRFHHYQSLPHIATAYLSVLFGTDRVFQVSLYLLLSLWPLAVYAGMRLFGWGPWPSALGALVSPLLASKPGLGYEDGSYAWRGYGTWSQLWGMWMLPLAWGLSWRAVAKKGSYALAALAVGLTICVHLLTGYLAVLSMGVWVLVKPPEILRRAGRAAIVAVGALCVASFMLVPLLLDVSVMPQSEISRGTIYYDSFGARQILAWLFTGQIFDRGRLVPAISLLVLAGFIVCVVRFRRDERARAVLAVGLFSLVLFFGRPTLGPVLKIFPGSSDLFLRRFIMGVHLAGIYLAGVGLAAIGRTVRAWLDRREIGWHPTVVTAVFTVLVAAVLFPAWSERAAWAAQGREWIHEQLGADATDGADLVALIDEAEQMGPGRIFAGLRGSGGEQYRVGQVPVYVYLLDHDADAVGFTRPAWSLSSAIEVQFQRTDPADYGLFAIHYLIVPAGQQPPVDASLVDERGNHSLWVVGDGGYGGVVDTTTPAILADRTNLGAKMSPFMHSSAIAEGRFPTVAFAGAPAAPPTITGDAPMEGPAGHILTEFDDPANGVFRMTVELDRPAMVILKSTYDNRWQVTVDGSLVDPQMVGPSFVGRTLPAGTHEVEFRYAAFPDYWLLFALAGVTLLGLWLIPRRKTDGQGPFLEEMADDPEGQPSD
jgi:hypothetical protein